MCVENILWMNRQENHNVVIVLGMFVRGDAVKDWQPAAPNKFRCDVQ